MGSAYTPHMKEDDVLYRGVLEYEQTPKEWVPNPDYNPGAVYNIHGVNTWSKELYVPTGEPDETITDIIGPYNSFSPIKSYITRNRDRFKNLRVIRLEKTIGWEEVEI